MRVIVACHKGGTGKTVTAAHLCFHLARQGTEVCAWDTDLQGNLLSWLTEHQWTGQESFRLSEDDQADIICTTEPATARSHKPLVVDTPPEIGAINDLRETIGLSEEDLIVCPTNGRLAVEGGITIAQEIADVGCRVLFVANKTDPKTQIAREELAGLEEAAEFDELSIELFKMAIPSNIKYMRKAEKRGVPVWDLDYANRTHTAKALRSLCEWIAEGAPRDNNPPDAKADGQRRSGPIQPSLRKRLWN